ncbi:MAG: hypothetical protein ACXWKD_15770, partial [Caldimonas sp.]
MGGLAVDGDAAFDDQVFHVAARADTGLGQHLVQLGRIGFGREHALAGRLFAFDRLDRFDLGVELARQQLGEDFAGLGNDRRLQVTRQRAFKICRQCEPRRGATRPVAVAAFFAAAPVAAATPPAAFTALAFAALAFCTLAFTAFCTLALAACCALAFGAIGLALGAAGRSTRTFGGPRVLALGDRRVGRACAFEIGLGRGVGRSVHEWDSRAGSGGVAGESMAASAA